MGSLADRFTPPPKRGADPAARGAGLRAAVFLIVAIVAALGAGILFSRYLDRRSPTGGVPTAKVVVAAADIPVATTLRPELLTVIDWPKAHTPEGAAHDPAPLVGKITYSQIAKGEAILPTKLATGGTVQGLAAILPPEMRGVSVRVDDVIGVAGFVHPGDRVDVIVTIKPREDQDAPFTSKVILQNVKVLAVGKELDRKTKQLDKAVPVTVATLMVNSADSEKLALAATKGQILLALRSGADAEAVETPGIIPEELLAGTAAARPPPKQASAPPPPLRPPVQYTAMKKPAEKPPEPAGHQVEILRGDRFEKRNFTPEAKP